jgi:predicted enzyme related to lactoylglutathione lyase
MTAPKVSAVLFAKDARRVADFYVAVFGAALLERDERHAALDARGFNLVVLQIPAYLAQDVDVRNPPVRRETGAIRLDYPVADIVQARTRAERSGGQIDDSPPAWAGADARFFLGFDPEGNVFGAFDANE